MSIADWFLFGCFAILFLLFGYHRFIESSYDAESYMDETEMRVKPDERGIIGELHDEDGVEYYAVMIPKEDFDREWSKADEEDGEADENDKCKDEKKKG